MASEDQSQIFFVIKKDQQLNQISVPIRDIIERMMSGVVEKGLDEDEKEVINILRMPELKLTIHVNIFAIQRYRTFYLEVSKKYTDKNRHKIYSMTPISFKHLQQGKIENPVWTPEDFNKDQLPPYDFIIENSREIEITQFDTKIYNMFNDDGTFEYGLKTENSRGFNYVTIAHLSFDYTEYKPYTFNNSISISVKKTDIQNAEVIIKLEEDPEDENIQIIKIKIVRKNRDGSIKTLSEKWTRNLRNSEIYPEGIINQGNQDLDQLD